MGELEVFFKVITVKVFEGLEREYGFLNAILISVAALLSVTVLAALMKFVVTYAAALAQKWPSSSELKGVIVLTAIATVGMLLAIADMPYSYYSVLHLIVCLTSVVAFTKARKARLEFWQWAFGVIAALYNPFLPVHFGDKSLWIGLNLLTVLMLWVGEYIAALTFARLESSALARTLPD